MNGSGQPAQTICANLVDVVCRQIAPSRIEIRDGKIAAIERVESAENFILPGFIDAHVHIESSMLLPSEFARVAVRHGTVATVSDPHEIANVCGIEGIQLMLRDAQQSPFKFYFGAPSCVPATAFETTGASLDADSVRKLLDDPRISHLSEVMNFPGVIAGDAEIHEKLQAARSRQKPIDGHAPGVRGDDLAAYLRAGISTDHECVSLDEAQEKLAAGCKISIREGSAARNFESLWPLIRNHSESCMFCSDDKHPDELLHGHIDQLVIRSLAHGCELFDVLQVACVNPVRHYRLDVGLLQLGDPADFVLVKDLESFQHVATYLDGQLVAQDGHSILKRNTPEIINNFDTQKIEVEALRVAATSSRMRVIEVLDGQLITGEIVVDVNQGTAVEPSASQDILKLVVLNRYHVAKPSVAFARGFGLQHGAIASSVAHDSHNIIAIGTNDDDLAAAINCLVDSRGGLCVVNGTHCITLPLPIAGLMSDQGCEQVAQDYSHLDQYAKSLGCVLSAPFMALSFLALPVIPKLKLTDKGLFDVEAFEFVTLFQKD